MGSTAIALLLTLWLEPLRPRTIGAFFYIASSWVSRVIHTNKFWARMGLTTSYLAIVNNQLKLLSLKF